MSERKGSHTSRLREGALTPLASPARPPAETRLVPIGAETVEPQNVPWRIGTKVGRTIYAQPHHEPRDSDPLIGVMDTPQLALAAVRAHNREIKERHRG